jgi:hypothetical protein
MIAAPGVAALVQLIWPYAQAIIVWTLGELSLSCKCKFIRWKIDRAIRDLEALKRRSLSPELKQEIERELDALRRARVVITIEGSRPHGDSPAH